MKYPILFENGNQLITIHAMIEIITHAKNPKERLKIFLENRLDTEYFDIKVIVKPKIKNEKTNNNTNSIFTKLSRAYKYLCSRTH